MTVLTTLLSEDYFMEVFKKADEDQQLFMLTTIERGIIFFDITHETKYYKILEALYYMDDCDCLNIIFTRKDISICQLMLLKKFHISDIESIDINFGTYHPSDSSIQFINLSEFSNHDFIYLKYLEELEDMNLIELELQKIIIDKRLVSCIFSQSYNFILLEKFILKIMLSKDRGFIDTIFTILLSRKNIILFQLKLLENFISNKDILIIKAKENTKLSKILNHNLGQSGNCFETK